MRDLFDTTMILPKCWLARIPKYWDETIPTNIPRSSSSFTYVATEAEKEAVEKMEEEINDPEKSIITPEAIGKHNALGSYLGTYDVVANSGERTLLSPNKLTNAVAALAYHYDDETDAWTQIEDAELDKDGYVWGSCTSFSPIAVFGVRRDTYIDESQAVYKFPAFVCNGIFTKIYKNDEDKIVAEDGYGKITEIDESYIIIGGTYDGTDIETTNISIVGVTVAKVVGGSVCGEHPVHVGTINVYCKDMESKNAITGAGVGCRVDKVVMNVENSKATGLGNGEAYHKGVSINKTLNDSALKLGAPQWTKESEITVSNSNIQVMYTAGNNGYCYTQNAKMYADNCEFEYLCLGQSNGTVDDSYFVVSNSKTKYLNSNNRGHYGSGKGILKGCEVENLYVFCDPTDTSPELADILGKVAWDLDANCKVDNTVVGSVGNGGIHEVTDPAECAEYLQYFKVSRSAEVTYAENAEYVLGDLLIVK